MISPRHSEVTQDKLREERQVESDEQNNGGDARQEFRIQTSRNLRPPEVDTTQIPHDCATHHDVVEVRHDEVGVMQVDIEAQASEEQSRQPADREEPDESQAIQHRRVVCDRTLVERGSPVKHFHCGRDRDQERQKRKCDR